MKQSAPNLYVGHVYEYTHTTKNKGAFSNPWNKEWYDLTVYHLRVLDIREGYIKYAKLGARIQEIPDWFDYVKVEEIQFFNRLYPNLRIVNGAALNE